jgi:outer membrane protein OmpA-like peptidoglycan-associated protein
MIRIVLLVFVLAVSTLLAHATEDCSKAKEIYSRGKDALNYSERKELFLQAVKLCPSYAEAHVNLADSYENLGDFDSAEKHYQEAVVQALRSPIPFIGLGEVYLKTGRYTLAAESYQKGLNIEAGNERLQAGLKVATERIKRGKAFFAAADMKKCLVEDEEFQLMCMCPGDQYSFLRKWICMPTLLFASGSTELSKEARRQLDEVGQVLKINELSGKSWLIIGHADTIGDQSRNKRLSKGRAEHVKKYLLDRHSLDPQRLKALSFGQDRPRGPNTTQEGRAENRRVEIVAEDL